MKTSTLSFSLLLLNFSKSSIILLRIDRKRRRQIEEETSSKLRKKKRRDGRGFAIDSSLSLQIDSHHNDAGDDDDDDDDLNVVNTNDEDDSDNHLYAKSSWGEGERELDVDGTNKRRRSRGIISGNLKQHDALTNEPEGEDIDDIDSDGSGVDGNDDDDDGRLGARKRSGRPYQEFLSASPKSSTSQQMYTHRLSALRSFGTTTGSQQASRTVGASRSTRHGTSSSTTSTAAHRKSKNPFHDRRFGNDLKSDSIVGGGGSGGGRRVSRGLGLYQPGHIGAYSTPPETSWGNGRGGGSRGEVATRITSVKEEVEEVQVNKISNSPTRVSLCVSPISSSLELHSSDNTCKGATTCTEEVDFDIEKKNGGERGRGSQGIHLIDDIVDDDEVIQQDDDDDTSHCTKKGDSISLSQHHQPTISSSSSSPSMSSYSSSLSLTDSFSARTPSFSSTKSSRSQRKQRKNTQPSPVSSRSKKVSNMSSSSTPTSIQTHVVNANNAERKENRLPSFPLSSSEQSSRASTPQPVQSDPSSTTRTLRTRSIFSSTLHKPSSPSTTAATTIPSSMSCSFPSSTLVMTGNRSAKGTAPRKKSFSASIDLTSLDGEEEAKQEGGGEKEEDIKEEMSIGDEGAKGKLKNDSKRYKNVQKTAVKNEEMVLDVNERDVGDGLEEEEKEKGREKMEMEEKDEDIEMVDEKEKEEEEKGREKMEMEEKDEDIEMVDETENEEQTEKKKSVVNENENAKVSSVAHTSLTEANEVPGSSTPSMSAMKGNMSKNGYRKYTTVGKEQEEGSIVGFDLYSLDSFLASPSSSPLSFTPSTSLNHATSEVHDASQNEDVIVNGWIKEGEVRLKNIKRVKGRMDEAEWTLGKDREEEEDDDDDDDDEEEEEEDIEFFPSQHSQLSQQPEVHLGEPFGIDIDNDEDNQENEEDNNAQTEVKESNQNDNEIHRKVRSEREVC